ncbi:CocE/NonD family hydrolase [Amycolatopsis anabasis]|uniref:CocE/NonD family hydrolase n=1 Tax=Amycolatopsis anabasis TaxID=1840409 RepID=UPI001C55351D|nr:CocE/NonD family hydrolase [Amycolatopsis anabasis]
MARRAGVVAVLLLVSTGVLPVAAAAEYGIAVTRDVPVTASDGTVLRADIYAPADPVTGAPAAGRFPVIVGLTPYGKGASAGANSPPGFGGLNPNLVRNGYLGVVVDVPGTGGSQGASQLFGPAEAAASVDVINWAARLPNSTGAVGMIGGSYLAIDQLFAAAAVGPNSPLKAIFPMAAAVDPYRDLFVDGGVFNVESSLGLILAYGGTRTLTPLAERAGDPLDAVNLAAQHLAQGLAFEGTTALDVLTDGPRRFDGPYWRTRAPETVLRKIVDNGVAAFLAGGSYDVFQRGEPLLYAGLQNAAAGRPVTAPMAPGQPVSPNYQLLFGPWHHGDIGAGVDLDRLQLRWFDHWLMGADTGITGTRAPLRIIQADGTEYRAETYPVRPGRGSRLHFDSGGRLAPAASRAATGADDLIFTGLSNPCSRSTDQFSAGLLSKVTGTLCTAPRPASPNPAELGYRSDPLAAPVTLAGPVGVTLHATSTTPETLWTVRLEEVAPDGKVTTLSGGAQLGSMRALDPARSWPAADGGWLRPYHPLTKQSRTAVTPGAITRYDIEVRPVFATIPAGHRIQLTVGTGDLPHLIPTTDVVNLLGGRYSVQHNAVAASWIDLPTS